MFGYLDFLFLSYSGRLGRAAYWLGNLGLMVLQWVVMFRLLQLSHSTLDRLTQLERGTHSLPPDILQDLMMHVGLPVLIVGLLFLYPSYAIATKRWQDRGKSGWWSLIAFVPIIGALWMLIELGFLWAATTGSTTTARASGGLSRRRLSARPRPS